MPKNIINLIFRRKKTTKQSKPREGTFIKLDTIDHPKTSSKLSKNIKQLEKVSQVSGTDNPFVKQKEN